MNLNKFIANNISESDEVLDVGSGDKSNQSFKCSKIISIDAWEKVNPDVLVDLNKENIPFDPNSFDVVLMIDFIEHLEKENGRLRIKEAIEIARKKVILLTPLWWDDNKDNTENSNLWCYNNPYNYHKSLWTIKDFDGWMEIEGIDGLNNYFLGTYSK